MDLLPAEKEQFCSIHQLDYRIPLSGTLQSASDDEDALDSEKLNHVTTTLFGIKFDQFKEKNVSGSKRGYDHVFVYKDSYINVYVKSKLSKIRRTIFIETNGSYFDREINHDPEKIASIRLAARQLEASIVECHPFIDDRMLVTTWDRLMKCYELKSSGQRDFMSHGRPVSHYSKGNDAPETLYVGSLGDKKRKIPQSDRLLAVYESGKYRRIADLQYLPYVRYEMRLTGEAAQQFYDDWDGWDKSLYELTLGLIKAQITFHKPFTGKNKTAERIKPTSWWRKFTDGVQSVKYSRPKGPDPGLMKKLSSFNNNVRRTMTVTDNDKLIMQEFMRAFIKSTSMTVDEVRAEFDLILSDYT